MAGEVVVIAVYGLPGSGKSVLTAGAAEVLRRLGHAVAIVELDAWLHDAVAARGADAAFDAELWHNSFNAFVAGVTQAASRLAEEDPSASSKCGVVFAVDNLYYRSMRWQVMRAVERVNDGEGDDSSDRRAAPAAVVGFATLLIECDAGTCAARNAGREGVHRVPPRVIERMAMRLEAGPVKRQPEGTHAALPARANSPDRPLSLVVSDLTELLLAEVLPAAASFIPRRPPPPAAATLPTEASLLHRCDLALRDMTRETVAAVRGRGVGSDACKRVATQLTTVKASALAEARRLAKAVATASEEEDAVSALLDRTRQVFDRAADETSAAAGGDGG